MARSEAIRITVPAQAWQAFEVVRDAIRRDPKLRALLPKTDGGTRRVLIGWIESQLRKEFGP
jgi:hypothetical protein